MPKAILVVQTNPTEPEREEEFNQWYTGTHLPDVLTVAGYTAAQRYRLVEGVDLLEGLEPPRQRYLAIYELDTDDLEQAAKDLRETVFGGDMAISDALDLGSVAVNFYVPISERVTAE
ncbi:MAG: hypothetical protein AB1679_32125 [Actinomycetota bacterium]|jgi:hypothetical protein